jgi:hypothetical protein
MALRDPPALVPTAGGRRRRVDFAEPVNQVMPDDHEQELHVLLDHPSLP